MPAIEGGPGLDKKQVAKAVAALNKWMAGEGDKGNAQLFEDDDELFYLNVSLKKVPQSAKHKPHRIEIPHPLYTFDGAEVCLFVKDHKGEGHKEMKKRVAEEKKSGVSKVIGVSKIKAKYGVYEARRNLCSAYDIFLADARILPLLPKLLGKTFFKKKKQPVPVDIAGKEWAKQIRAALSATYMFTPGGTCLNVKVARTGFSAKEVVENVVKAMEGIAKHVPKGWAGVQAVYLKTAESAALPVYAALPEIHLGGEPLVAGTEQGEGGASVGKGGDKGKKEKAKEKAAPAAVKGGKGKGKAAAKAK